MDRLKDLAARMSIDTGSERAIAITMVVASVILAVFAGTYLWIVNENMELTETLWEKHVELNAIRNQNIVLEMEIARESSILSLVVRSHAMGYEPATSIDFIEEQ